MGNGDVALAAIDKLPETTEDIRIARADIRVLGRKEFRMLLKWRLKVREKFGLATKKTKAPAEEEIAERDHSDAAAHDSTYRDRSRAGRTQRRGFYVRFKGYRQGWIRR